MGGRRDSLLRGPSGRRLRGNPRLPENPETAERSEPRSGELTRTKWSGSRDSNPTGRQPTYLGFRGFATVLGGCGILLAGYVASDPAGSSDHGTSVPRDPDADPRPLARDYRLVIEFFDMGAAGDRCRWLHASSGRAPETEIENATPVARGDGQRPARDAGAPLAVAEPLGPCIRGLRDPGRPAGTEMDAQRSSPRGVDPGIPVADAGGGDPGVACPEVSGCCSRLLALRAQ